MGYASASLGVFTKRGHECSVVWMGLALSYHLLCRAPKIWVYGNGLVHPDFCLTRRDVMFFRGTTQLACKDRPQADKVEVVNVPGGGVRPEPTRCSDTEDRSSGRRRSGWGCQE